MLKNLLLLVCAVVISVVLGEWAVRVMYSEITTTYDNRSYFALKWKNAHVHLNGMKYREREFDQPKPPGLYRIAFIGDSFTFGQGITEVQRMSNLLERELRKERNNVEVLNFGRSGDNTADQVKALKLDVLPKADPDFVLLQWYVNDVEYKPPQASAALNLGIGQSSLLNDFKQKMLNTSVLYFLLADAVHWARDRAGVSYEEELFSRVGDPNSPESREAEQAMLDFVRLCKDRNVPVGIVLIPQLSPLKAKAYPFLYLHQRVSELCSKENVKCVDLLDVFYPYLVNGAHASLWVNRFDPHMGPLANELAARQVLGVFGSDWAANQTLTQAR